MMAYENLGFAKPGGEGSDQKQRNCTTEAFLNVDEGFKGVDGATGGSRSDHRLQLRGRRAR
jgi:hypothetical protein